MLADLIFEEKSQPINIRKRNDSEYKCKQYMENIIPKSLLTSNLLGNF